MGSISGHHLSVKWERGVVGGRHVEGEVNKFLISESKYLKYDLGKKNVPGSGKEEPDMNQSVYFVMA
jgi:hypothetical protein